MWKKKPGSAVQIGWDLLEKLNIWALPPPLPLLLIGLIAPTCAASPVPRWAASLPVFTPRVRLSFWLVECWLAVHRWWFLSYMLVYLNKHMLVCLYLPLSPSSFTTLGVDFGVK